MTTQPGHEPGSTQAAEAPTQPGYGNDTGFAQEAEDADEAVEDTSEETDTSQETGS